MFIVAGCRWLLLQLKLVDRLLGDVCEIDGGTLAGTHRK
jgi:hypothetical protein